MNTPPPFSVHDSALTHEQLRMGLEAIEREQMAHAAADEKAFELINSKLDRLLTTRIQIRTLAGACALVMAVALAGGQWVITQAVQSALIANGVVELKPRGAP